MFKSKFEIPLVQSKKRIYELHWIKKRIYELHVSLSKHIFWVLKEMSHLSFKRKVRHFFKHPVLIGNTKIPKEMCLL